MGFEGNRKIVRNFLIVIIIALLAFTGYIILANNSKYKVKAAIKYVFNQTDNTLGLAQNSPMTNAFMDNKVEITNRIVAKASLSDDTIETLESAGKSIEDLINNSTIETNIKTDIPNKYIDFGLNYSYKNEIITANAYISNNELYIYLKNYFDKYLTVDTEDFDADQFFDQITSGLKVDEVRYLMDILKKSVVDSIDYGTFTSSKVEIDVYEEKLAVNKTTLTIDTALKNKASTIFFNKILRDSKAKEIILKVVDSDTYPSVAFLEDDIRDELFDLETSTYDNKVLGEYSIYTSGIFNNVIRNEFKNLDGYENVIQITTYKTTVFDTQIAIYENNNLTLQSNIKETSADNYDITIVSGQDTSMDIKGVISQSLIDITYIIRMSGLDDIKGDFMLQTNEISENAITQKFNLKLNTPESYGTVNLTIDTTLKVVDSIVKPDFVNSVNLNLLTTKQTNDIMTNFQNKNPKIINVINEITSQLMGM
ncbi:MAG: hypothetical protein PHD15_02580 [Clostridia bacterium]|nr:hypothetical protein [Clostridia bacterium]MDD4386633.1 hypothetical protein [Clostridia bacterium]